MTDVENGKSLISTYNCRRCKLAFATKRDSLLHKKTVHDSNPDQNKFICEICNKGFANHGNMYRHLRSHGDVRPHTCNLCGKSFAQAANLQRHHSVHNGERPFTCGVCNKGFTQQGNLRRHELIHTGEKPFRCKRCGRMFSQRVNLKKHVMLHQGYKPFVCEICNRSFLQNQNYQKHMQRHSEKDIKSENMIQYYECAMCGVSFSDFADFESHEIFCEVAGEEQIETTVVSQQHFRTMITKSSSTPPPPLPLPSRPEDTLHQIQQETALITIINKDIS